MIRNAIQRFMYGRYGTDQLNLALLGLYLVLYLVSALTRWGCCTGCPWRCFSFSCFVPSPAMPPAAGLKTQSFSRWLAP